MKLKKSWLLSTSVLAGVLLGVNVASANSNITLNDNTDQTGNKIYQLEVTAPVTSNLSQINAETDSESQNKTVDNSNEISTVTNSKNQSDVTSNLSQTNAETDSGSQNKTVDSSNEIGITNNNKNQGVINSDLGQVNAEAHNKSQNRISDNSNQTSTLETGKAQKSISPLFHNTILMSYYSPNINQWHYNSNTNEWTYSKDNGQMATKEWLKIDNSWYYFDEAGVMAANGWHSTYVNHSYEDYYFDANGHYEVSQWHYNPSSNDWTYSDIHGKRITRQWAWINNSWYYFDEAGVMATNGWHSTYWNHTYYDYYFDANGHYEVSQWHYNPSSNDWTYSDIHGKRITRQWAWINNSWYYFDEAGVMATNGWHSTYWNHTYYDYYFDANGHYLYRR